MSSYHTKPKEEILSYLEQHREEQFTIKMLLEELPSVSQSTLYRMVGELFREGKIRRFQDQNRNVSYQYLSPESCANHLHIQCTRCGKLVHLESEASGQLAAVLQGKEFEPDEHTMLYGCCKNCLHCKKEERV